MPRLSQAINALSCAKALDMKVRHCFQNLVCLNNEELPNLPPQRANQKLSKDEVLDILLFGTPCSWQTKMEQLGFDPMEHTLVQVAEFMENIKSVEPTLANPEPKKEENEAKTEKKDDRKPPHHCKSQLVS